MGVESTLGASLGSAGLAERPEVNRISSVASYARLHSHDSC
jgi:hypothetical protein